MNKLCTDISQSKKLLELGIDVNTADMDYIPCVNDLRTYSCVINEWNNEHEENWIPAWSLSVLFEIIPNVEIKSKVQNFDNKSWCISSHDDKDHNHIWVYNNELINACVELIIKLKEQNLI